MITLGDKGAEVAQLQKYLSMLGYDLIIDAHFGNKTLRSLKAFQKKYGLAVDGVAGPKTIATLKAAQKRTAKENKESKYGKKYGDLDVNTEYNQPSEQYVKQSTPKDKLFLHYTVSGPDSKSVIKYWDRNAERISTAFVISGRGQEDGKIYEVFNPDFWSFHLGVKGSKGKLDRSSIGIEICSWGKLNKKGEKFFNTYGAEVPLEEVYTLKQPWRGSLYFHSYSDKQLESLEKLIMWIVSEYKIPVQDIEFNREWSEYNNDVVSGKLSGIWTHTNVRMDKQDTYPDHRIFEILNRIRIKVNGK